MKRPNLLIVMTDHQRADTILPEHPCLTPNIDKFISEGVLFTNTYCPSPHCCPSRATFFSGLYPSGHGVWNNVLNGMALHQGLNKGIKLWSEDLAESGYDMHFCGKWHVSAIEGPAERGWQEYYVSAVKGTMHGIPWERYKQIADEPAALQRGEGRILRPGYGTYRMFGTRPPEGDPHDEKVVNDTLLALRSVTDSDKPWCIYSGLIGPHDPYDVPQRYLDLYRLEDVPLPKNYSDPMLDKPRIYQRMRNQIFGQLSEREVREGIRHFWAYCSYLDDLFGRILTGLEATGQAENTLVLFCSDHGDYCGEHGLFAKGIPCFQGAYHVPAVIRYPAGIYQPGRRVDDFVSLADFAPTFLEAANCPVDRRFSGASLMPFLRNDRPCNWREAIFTQCNGVELYYSQRSVMTHNYKYTFNGFDFDELYDLRDDPGETKNLIGHPAYESIKKDLCKKLWEFAYEEGDTLINPYITTGLAPYGPAVIFE